MSADEGTLVATSGDGSLVAMDMRQRRLLQRSDTNESELLSLAIVKASGAKPVQPVVPGQRPTPPLILCLQYETDSGGGSSNA